MTRRGLRLVGALLSVVAVHTAPAAVAAAPPVLSADVTLTGSVTGYVRVRLARPLAIADLRRPDTVYTGTGTVGLALLSEAPGGPGAVAVRLPEIAWAVATSTGPDYAAALLPAGTYRLYLLTRGGAGSVRVRLPGRPGGPQRLAVRAPVAWSYRDVASPLSPPAAVPVAPSYHETTFDFGSRPAGVVFGAMWLHGPGSAGTQVDACFEDGPARPPREPACLGTEDPNPHRDLPPGSLTSNAYVLFTARGYLAPPRAGAALTMYYAAAGPVSEMGGVLFHLPRG